MKNFLKSLWGGFVTTITIFALALVFWVFFTLGLVLGLLLSPVLWIVASHWSYKTKHLKEFADNFLNDLERIIKDAENDLP